MTLKYHFQIAQQDTHGPRNVARTPCSTLRKDHMVCYICKILDWQVLSRILILWVLYLTILKKNGFGAQHLPTFVWPLNDLLGGGHQYLVELQCPCPVSLRAPKKGGVLEMPRGISWLWHGGAQLQFQHSGSAAARRAILLSLSGMLVLQASHRHIVRACLKNQIIKQSKTKQHEAKLIEGRGSIRGVACVEQRRYQKLRARLSTQ